MTEPRRAEAVRVRRVQHDTVGPVEQDWLAVEEPLEIRAEGAPLAITMRTPGDDLDLVAGFLYSEGVIDGPDDLTALAHVDDPRDPQGNTVDVVFASGVPAARRQNAQRAFFASSSCGVCGKATIDRLLQQVPPLTTSMTVAPAVIQRLPDALQQAQAVFGRTGGLHAAGLFDARGRLEILREDIGRHNAVDKVLGWRLRQDRAPVADRILLVSGRAGFEIVQKAAIARVPVLAAVGAPSSMAARFAGAVGLTLIGFLRDGRYNLYLP